MRIAESGTRVTHDLTQTSAFGIQMGAKLYSILTDRLYTDKPGAVVRELSANAMDAHTAAGTLRPFDIQIPTLLKPFFHIRDYGTGIDPDLFEDIYTNIGRSTKDDSDDFVGAYGLGSKTPFALVDAYTIENYYHGAKYVYQCFKDKGMPQVSLIGAENTDDPDGLKVSFALLRNLEREFKDSIRTQLVHFKVRPNIIGSKIEWPERVTLKDGWGISSSPDFNMDINVVVGGICYPLSWYSCDIPYGSLSDLRNKNIVLEAQIGDVDIPPSRETLEMTEKTLAWLKETLKGVQISLVEAAKEDFKASKNAREATLSVMKYMVSSNDTCMIGGHEMRMSRNVLVDSEDLLESLPVCRILRSKRVDPSPSAGQYMHGLLAKGYLHINDLGPRAWGIIQTEGTAEGLEYVTAGTRRKDEMASHVATSRYAAAVLGLETKLLSEHYALPVVMKGVKGPIKMADQVFSVSLANKHVPPNNALPAMPEKGWYVHLLRNEIITPDYFELLKHMPAGDTVYALRSRALDKVHLQPGMKPLGSLTNSMVEGWKKEYATACKLTDRRRLLSMSGMPNSFGMNNRPVLAHPSLALVQTLARCLYGNNSFPRPSDVLALIHKYEKDYVPPVLYTPHHRLVEAVSWCQRHSHALWVYSKYEYDKHICSLNELIKDLGETP